MVDKIKIVIVGIFFSLTSVIFGGEQRVNITFIPTFKGASTQVVGNNQVIDLGFLKEGQSYTGANKIDIGTVHVNISQKKTGTDDPCILEDIQFDSVNISKLKMGTEQIASTEKSYIGNFSGMTLSAGGVSNIRYTGTMKDETMDAYFTDPGCMLMDDAIYTLDYDFKLYAEIPMTEHGVVGAFAQDKATKKELALKDIVIRQILGSVGGGIGSRSRRR